MSVVLVIIFCIVLFSVFRYFDCLDKAESENFKKDWEEYKKEHPASFLPYVPVKRNKIDKALDWLIGEENDYNYKPPPRERDVDLWK